MFLRASHWMEARPGKPFSIMRTVALGLRCRNSAARSSYTATREMHSIPMGSPSGRAAGTARLSPWQNSHCTCRSWAVGEPCARRSMITCGEVLDEQARLGNRSSPTAGSEVRQEADLPSPPRAGLRALTLPVGINAADFLGYRAQTTVLRSRDAPIHLNGSTPPQTKRAATPAPDDRDPQRQGADSRRSWPGQGKPYRSTLALGRPGLQ